MSLLPRVARTAALALLAAAALWAVFEGLTCSLGPGDGGASSELREVVVERGHLRETVVATGRTEPLTKVLIQSEIAGVVEVVHVDDGDRVHVGEPLVELDSDHLRDRVAELRAALDMARAEARIERVKRARADLDQAEREFRRVARMFEDGVVSKEQYEAADHARALANLAVADARSAEEAGRAAVVRAEQAVRRAERDLGRAVIRSPLDGVVVRREVEVGSAVTDLEHGGTPIAVLADDRRIHIVAEVDEHDIAVVREGQPCEVHVDALPDEAFEGHVRKVSWSGSQTGRLSTFEIEVELPSDPRLRVGMSADARVLVREHARAILVPNTAIVRRNGEAAVRIRSDGGEPVLVRIREGYSDGFHTVVLGGLSEGDRVMVYETANGDDRRVLLLCYNSVENPLQDPFGGNPPRPSFITNRTIEAL